MRGRHARGALSLALVLAMGAGMAAAQAPPPPPTVETLAGPGFCEGATVVDATPGRVGALAVDTDGRVYTDLVDAPGRGVVRAVDGTQVRLLTSNEPAAPAADPLRGATAAPAASRLAGGDGGAGVVVAAGPRVIEVDANPPSLRVIAGTVTGQPAAPVPSTSGDGGPATAARFSSARSVAADAEHNLFIADQVDAATATFVVRFVNRGERPVTFYQGTADQLTVAPGHIHTIAGMTGPAAAGDGGPATRAVLQGVPPSLAVAGDRLYVASYWDRPGSAAPGASVRVVNLGGEPLTAHGVGVGPGMIETVAGGPPGSPDTDGVPAREAALSYVPGVATDEAGGLYLVEQLRNRVRFVDGDGRISTFAGTSQGPSLGTGGLDRPATQAALDRPVDVKVAPGRRVLVSDEGSGRVLVVDPGGVIRLAAGSSRTSRCAAGGAPGRTAGDQRPAEGQPYSVVAGEAGDIYFVNLLSRQVMRRDRAGTTTVLLAPGEPCSTAGACAPSSLSELRSPAALALSGRALYVYDVIGARVLVLNLGERAERANGVVVAPGQLAVVTGTGSAGSAGDGGPAAAAQLGGQGATTPGTFPALPSILLTEGAVGDIAVDRGGNLFIGDGANGRIRAVSTDGVITTVAGTGGPAGTQGCCTEPSGLATDAFGNLYVSDMATRQVWFLNRSPVAAAAHGQSVPAGGAVAVAGTGRRGFGADGPALDISLYQPTGLVADGRGNLYIAEYQDQTVRRLDASGALSTVAGTGAGGFNGDGLPARQAALFNPTDVALDHCGNLLVADLRNDRIRRVNLAGPCDPPLAAPQPGTSDAGPPWWLVGVGGALVIVVGVTATVGRGRRSSRS